MRVPLLAALAIISASCADGTQSAITAPEDPSFAIRGAAAKRIATCRFSQRQVVLRAGGRQRLSVACFDRRGRRLGVLNPRHSRFATANGQIASVSSDLLVVGRAAGTTMLRYWNPELPYRDSILVTVTGRSAAPPAGGPGPQPAPAPAPAPAPNTPPGPGTGPSPVPLPAPLPPLPPPVHGSNEPSGFGLISDRHFRTKHPDYGYGSLQKYPNSADLWLAEGWSSTEGNYANFTIQTDPTAPSGDGKVAQMFYPAGMKSGTGPAKATLYLPPNTREAYIAVWMKLSPNWVGNQASINKMFFVGMSGGNNQFIFEAYGAGSSKLQPMLALQGVLDNNTRSQLHRPNLGNGRDIRRGQWQKIEVLLRCNSSPNVANGTMDLWVDGFAITSVRNVSFTKKSDPNRPCNVNQFNWNPTYGGGGASPGTNIYQWFDRVYISGR